MSRKLLLVSLALLLFPAGSFAQQPPRLQISGVRVGFPAGSPGPDIEMEKPPLFKAGCWAPTAMSSPSITA